MRSQNATVLDLGSLNVKMGLSGEEAPKQVFTNHIGLAEEERFVFEGLAQPIQGEIVTPFRNGVVQNMDNYEFLVLQCLQKCPCKDLVLGDNFISKADRSKLCEILFEKAHLQSLFLAKQAVLSAFSAGKQSACILDIGAYQSLATNVFDGFCINKNVYPLGGEHLNQLVTEQLLQQNQSISFILKDEQQASTSYQELQQQNLLRQFKISQLSNQDQNYQQAFELPDGSTIALQPNQANNIVQGLFGGPKGIHEMVLETLNSSELKESLKNNILLTGGSSAIRWVDSRLQQLINQKGKLIEFPNNSNRMNSVFIGGSILGSLSSLSSLFLTKADYSENPRLLDQKFSFN